MRVTGSLYATGAGCMCVYAYMFCVCVCYIHRVHVARCDLHIAINPLRSSCARYDGDLCDEGVYYERLANQRVSASLTVNACTRSWLITCDIVSDVPSIYTYTYTYIVRCCINYLFALHIPLHDFTDTGVEGNNKIYRSLSRMVSLKKRKKKIDLF